MAITPVKDLVATAKSEIETIPLEEARALHGSDDVLFVDIRDVRELQRDGRIPGAMHAPRGMLEFWVDPQSPYHKPEFAEAKKLVLFCASAWRSALAAKTLKDMGVETVAEMDGGFMGWRKADYPIETE